MSFGLGPLPTWLASDRALVRLRGHLLGAVGQKIWAAAPSTRSRQAIEAATGHPVQLLLSTSSELDLLSSGAEGFDSIATRAAAGLVDELPGQLPIPSFVGGGPPAFEIWLAALIDEWQISPLQAGEALSLATGISFVQMDEFVPQQALLEVIGEESARLLRAIPLHHDGRTIHYATPNLPTLEQGGQVAKLLGAQHTQPLLCTLGDFARVSFRAVERSESLEHLIKADLTHRGLLPPARLRAVERLAAKGGQDLRECLVDLGILSEGQMTELMAEVLGIPADPHPRPDAALCGLLSVPIMKALDAVLIGQGPLTVRVATSRRPSPSATELIERLIGKQVVWFYTPPRPRRCSRRLPVRPGAGLPFARRTGLSDPWRAGACSFCDPHGGGALEGSLDSFGHPAPAGIARRLGSRSPQHPRAALPASPHAGRRNAPRVPR